MKSFRQTLEETVLYLEASYKSPSADRKDNTEKSNMYEASNDDHCRFSSCVKILLFFLQKNWMHFFSSIEFRQQFILPMSNNYAICPSSRE